jgi:serine protease
MMGINCSDPGTDRTILYGYEGIKYAAENGADVINCSWGRSGIYSSFEADMIAYATSLGSVVVAAAGNEASTSPQYPASYKNVLAIAGTDASDNKYTATNYGDFVDLAAPGVNIYNCKHGNTYGYSTGTSMSSPMAAGVVALVKTQHPEWLGIQAAEQVRVTADSLPAYGSDLGRGRLNAFRAVTESSPSIRIARFDYMDGNNNRIIEPGEQVALHITLVNYLAAAGETSIHLQTSDPYISVEQGESQLSGLSMLEEKELIPAFVFSVAENAPGAHYVTFDLLIGSGNYQDLDHITVSILPAFGDLDINDLAVTVTNIGRIGHPNPDQPAEGVGFSYKSGADLLFEGALICGTGESRLSNAARNGTGGFDQDFAVVPDGDISILTPGSLSDQESLGIFNDSHADLPLPVRLTQATYAWHDSTNNDYVIFLYTILNNSSSALNNFYFGLFFDWDIDGGNYATNVIDYDAGRQLGYAYDTGAGPDTYAGVVSLSDAGVSFRAIFNDETDPANPDWGIYDGFSDAEKWSSISGGITYTSAGPADVSMVIGNGPFNIPAKSVQRVAYAVLAADDSLQLMRAADSARAKWGELIVTGMAGFTSIQPPETFYLSQNYPNPFNPITTINYELPITNYVELAVYNILGQKIASLVSDKQQAGHHQVKWNAAGFASGIYYYRLEAGNFVQTKKLVLLK